MQFGHGRRTATAVAVAVIGGLFGAAPHALAAPTEPGSPSASTPDRADASALPSVWPRPQTMRAAGRSVPLGDTVTVVAGVGADAYAVRELADVLRAAGVRTVRTAAETDAPAGSAPVILAGGSGARDALRALRAPDRGDLPSGGYRIAVGAVDGRDTIALDGVGDDGLFHAAQTLRQLIVRARAGSAGAASAGAGSGGAGSGGAGSGGAGSGGAGSGGAGSLSVPGVTVRDWPGTAVRGTTEGFYGQPWTRSQRLAQLDFMGRTKQNRYLYAPGDDPYRQARWRDPYPAEQRADFRALAERARRNHVTLAWAVSPAQAMCLSSADDVKALNRKIDAMWALGVRAFQLQFQDVSYEEWHCAQDARLYGSGPEAAAKAQAAVANAVAARLAERHTGAEALTVMPTEYYQNGATAYRTALSGALDAGVQVAWTGVGVVPRTITGQELMGARDAFKRPLVTMDNYPVNDYDQGRIFLGPYTGREPAVATGSVALLANAMEQPSVSRIPLFTAADFAWNPRGYEPRESWQAAMDDLAGADGKAREALRALAGNDASSILDPSSESAYLKPLLDAFWRTRAAADPKAGKAAATRLKAAFTVMREAPEQLSGTAGGALEEEIGPWLDQLARYGRAGELAVDMLTAQARGDGAAAWRYSVALEPLREAASASRITVGKGVLGPFLDRAAEESAQWTGADRVEDQSVTEESVTTGSGATGGGATGGGATGGGAGASGGTGRTFTVSLGRPRPVETLNTMTKPGTGTGATVEAHVPGQGWRALGKVSASGWTESDAKGLRVDAVRLVWSGAPGAVPPSEPTVVPWFADDPKARLDLDRSETDPQIGGKPEKVEARLAAARPTEVKGALTAKAPSGIRVRVPKETTVPRGSHTKVPLEVSVPKGTPAGTYEVPLAFAGEERTLTVRASPAIAGPDLARTATASSSGDETSDFPASAVTDGDPGTRWSSPAEDGAWVQLELARPERVGRVVLRWQEAYASRYRVQVSADGRTWRTAATVNDGRGGRESVGMDAEDTRFVRVQGDARATRFGYSLFSVEAYAVAE